MNEKTIYNRVSKDRQTGRMKTPEMLYQQLDRITDYRFCKRDKLTEEERAIIVAWGKKNARNRKTVHCKHLCNSRS